MDIKIALQFKAFRRDVAYGPGRRRGKIDRNFSCRLTIYHQEANGI
jgi:hypothetical protein